MFYFLLYVNCFLLNNHFSLVVLFYFLTRIEYTLFNIFPPLCPLLSPPLTLYHSSLPRYPPCLRCRFSNLQPIFTTTLYFPHFTPSLNIELGSFLSLLLLFRYLIPISSINSVKGTTQ